MAVKRKAAAKKEAAVGPLTEFYTDVLNNVAELKEATSGEIISGPFLRLPPKKLYPDYYQLIAEPVSINEIRSASIVKKRGVLTRDQKDGNGVPLDTFLEMWDRMFKNASTYNDPDSLIVNDARTILDYVKERVEAFRPTYDEFKSTIESSNSNTDDKDYNDINDAVNDDYNEEAENDDEDDAFESETEKQPATKKRKPASRKRVQSDIEDEESFDEELAYDDDADNDDEEEDVGSKRRVKSDRVERNIDDDLFDADFDCTPDLMKIYKHLLSFKVSHHKNSIPLSKVFMDLPKKGAPETEDYYVVVSEPISFNIVKKNLDTGVYANGVEGYRKFVRDVNMIFDNAFDVWGDGQYLKSATGLSKAFEKRIEKFESQLLDKKKVTKPLKTKSTKTKLKLKEPAVPDYENDEQDEGDIEDQVLDDLAQTELQAPVYDGPTFIRKHDVEKAENVEEIDDITAFIKKFILCSSSNLSGYLNTLKNDKALPASNKVQVQKGLPALYETIILEPAGNSTVGGSTYSLQLPGSLVAGNEMGCSVFLGKEVMDQKYITELRVNGEIINGIENQQDVGEEKCFRSNNYSIRVGYGLNYFEFTLKVPFPLNGESVDEENPKEFIENVKVWLNVTR